MPLLIVEDDPGLCAVLPDLLQQLGFQAKVATTQSAAAEILRQDRPSLMILDVTLKHRDAGEDPAVLARAMGVPVLLMTGDMGVIQQLEDEGASFLQKPFRMAELRQEIDRLLAKAGG